MSTTTPTPSAEATQPETDNAQSSAVCCRRRTVLRTAGLVALSGGAVALAGCSSDSSATGTPSAPASSAAPSASPTASAPSEPAASSPAAASSEAVPEGPSVAISEVAVGGGIVVEEKYVVTQPTDGQFKAFSAICTHQGCPVGSVENGEIVCPCHNSHFDISTGDPVSGPAQEALSEVAFTTSGDTIIVTE